MIRVVVRSLTSHPCSSAFICVVQALLVTASAGVSLVDDTGRKVELAAPAQRIVTLAPSLTELVYSAGAGARLVGVSAHSDYPPAAKALPVVASALGPSLEPLLALEPDLVLAWRDSIRDEDVARIERLGVPVFVTQAKRLEDVPRLLAAVGRLAGVDSAGAARAFRERLAALRSAHANRPRLAAFVEIWHRPLLSISGPHWISEALEICGAANAFADLPGPAPHVSWEELYARDPAVIVGMGSAPDAARFRAQWQERATLAAVRAGRLVFVEGDTIQRPTLRLAEGVASLCAGLEAARGR
jgi:iron complex transport system substrate-binding protein